MAHVIGTKMLVRDYNKFGILDLKTGETEWMEKISVPTQYAGDGERQYSLNGVSDTSPTRVFEMLSR